MQIISGTQECRFLSPLEYDTTQFPASSVTYEWSYDSSTNTVFQKIRYNDTFIRRIDKRAYSDLLARREWMLFHARLIFLQVPGGRIRGYGRAA